VEGSGLTGWNSGMRFGFPISDWKLLSRVDFKPGPIFQGRGWLIETGNRLLLKR
jgi:hypothetical protein